MHKSSKKPASSKKKYKGFSLVEVIVIMSIIAFLLSLVFVSLSAARLRSFDTAIKTHLREIRIALEGFANDHGGYPNDGDGEADFHCLSNTDCEAVIGGNPVTISETLPQLQVPDIRLNMPLVSDDNGNQYKGVIYRDCASTEETCSTTDPDVGIVVGTEAQGAKFYPTNSWEPTAQVPASVASQSCQSNVNMSHYSCVFSVLQNNCEDNFSGLCEVNGPNSCGWRTCAELEEYECHYAYAHGGWCQWR